MFIRAKSKLHWAKDDLLMLSVSSLVTTHWRTITLFGATAAVLAVLVSFVRPLEYRATVRLLVVPRGTLGIDPYTVLKSAERIGDTLSQVVHTSNFFEKVISNTRYRIDQGRFPQDEAKRRRMWKRKVDPMVVRGTAVFGISVYDKRRDEALEIAGAIAEVFATQGWEYIPGDVQLKVVDAPVATKFPVRPHVGVRALLGFALGALAGLLYVIFHTHRTHERLETLIPSHV